MNDILRSSQCSVTQKDVAGGIQICFWDASVGVSIFSLGAFDNPLLKASATTKPAKPTHYIKPTLTESQSGPIFLLYFSSIQRSESYWIWIWHDLATVIQQSWNQPDRDGRRFKPTQDSSSMAKMVALGHANHFRQEPCKVIQHDPT